MPPPPPLVPPTGALPPGRRATFPWVWVLGTIAVVAIGLLLWALLRGDGTDPSGTPSATPSTSQPAQSSQAPPTTQQPSTTPTPTPSESPTPTADPADPVRAALAAFSDEVAAVEADGLVDKNAAKKLDEGVRNLEKALRDGDPQKVSDSRDQLVEDYDTGVQDGTITPDAQARLDPPLADLNDSVDTYLAG